MITLPASIDTLYVMIVDRSGSMGGCQASTVEGMNLFLEEQKKKEVKNAYVCLYQFDSSGSMHIEKTFDMVPLERTRLLGLDDYTPRGGTPLYQAVGEIVTQIRGTVEGAENPPAVIVQIITDGGNTDHLGWTKESVAELTNTLENIVGGWTFTYAGANQDAEAVAAGLGISAGNTIQYATGKMSETFSAMAASASDYAVMNTTLRSTDKKARFATKNFYDKVDRSELV